MYDAVLAQGKSDCAGRKRLFQSPTCTTREVTVSKVKSIDPNRYRHVPWTHVPLTQSLFFIASTIEYCKHRHCHKLPG